MLLDYAVSVCNLIRRAICILSICLLIKQICKEGRDQQDSMTQGGQGCEWGVKHSQSYCMRYTVFELSEDNENVSELRAADSQR